MRLLVSSVGVGEYKMVRYQWSTPQGNVEEYCTPLFPLAAARFFQPDRVLLLVTEKAAKHENCQLVKDILGNRVSVQSIPEGHNESELWEIFDRVTEAITAEIQRVGENQGAGDPSKIDIVLDVTHAFRSLQFVILSVINYLRYTEDRINLERIVYGAFEARDRLGAAPVFDLTMLLDLQNWLQASHTFIKRGEGRELAELLDTAHRRAWAGGHAGRDDQPQKLQKMSGKIKDFSEATRLLRPLKALETAAKVVGQVTQEAKAEAARWAKPFRTVMDRVVADTKALAADKPGELTSDTLEKQLALINYYLNKDLVVQAVLLGREWVVNWLALKLEKESAWLNRDLRSALEELLGQAAQSRRATGNTGDHTEPKERPAAEIKTKFDQLQQNGFKDLGAIWDQALQLRNDVAHCGMREDPVDFESLRQQARELAASLERLLKKLAQTSQ